MNKEEAKGKKLIITLKTVFGLEEVLVEELAELGYKDSKILNRAVQIKGTWNDVYYLNVHLNPKQPYNIVFSNQILLFFHESSSDKMLKL